MSQNNNFEYLEEFNDKPFINLEYIEAIAEDLELANVPHLIISLNSDKRTFSVIQPDNKRQLTGLLYSTASTDKDFYNAMKAAIAHVESDLKKNKATNEPKSNQRLKGIAEVLTNGPGIDYN